MCSSRLVALWLLALPAFGQVNLPLLGVSAGSGPITPINHGHNSGHIGGATTTPAINMTGAKLLVMYCASFSSGATPSDSLSNTWTPLTQENTGSLFGQLFYAANPTVGSSQTFTCSSSVTNNVYALGFGSAATSSPFDVQNTNTASATTVINSGSVTPGSNKEVLVGGAANYFASTVGPSSVNNGFTLVDSDNSDGANLLGSGVAYLVQTTAAATSVTFTMSGLSSELVAGIATFKHQ